MPEVRAWRALLSRHPEAMEVQKVREAILGQGRDDLRGFADLPRQVARSSVDARELQEWNQFI